MIFNEQFVAGKAMEIIMAKREKKAYTLAKKVFDNYFSSLAVNDKSIRFITYQERSDEKGQRVYSAVIDYENFIQHINFYEKSTDKAFINCVFEFEKYFCHFGEILNAIDSDDLSFYSYPLCYSKNLMLSALNNIINATKKYMSDIAAIAASAEMQEKIYNNLTEYADEKSLAEKNILTDYDGQYLLFEALTFNTDEGYQDFLKSLKRKKKKGKLTAPYEIRAERVLSKLSKKGLRDVHTKIKMTRSDKLYLYTPYAIIALAFAVIFGYIGVRIQANLYKGYIGFDYFNSALGFGTAGASLSVIATSLINNVIYKTIVPKHKKEHFNMLLAHQKSTPFATISGLLGAIALSAFFIVMFTCSGFGFKDNEIRHRKYIFEPFETYYFEQVEIAEVKGTTGKNGYSEYMDTAYAFKLNGEWFEYGVPDAETKKLIEKNIEKYNKQLIIAKSAENLK